MREPGGLDRWLGRLNGPQTMGSGPVFWLGFLALVAVMAALPNWVSRYQIINFSNFLISGLLALSLALIWGYCGILSLGQAAFFGIGGYAYGIVGLNLMRAHGNTDVALLAGMAVPAAFAAIVGGVMFFARLKGVYVAILMLVVSLLLGTFMRQTADPSYTIGAAYLGGMNGLRPANPDDPLLPSLTFGLGDWAVELDGRSIAFYRLVLAVLVVIYLGLRWLLNSSYGYLLIGCREDQERTETFGYDVRLIQLGVFSLSAALAGLAGTLYTAWGTYIHPDGFGVAPNILVVIWVAVGGRKDLGAAILGAVGLSWLSIRLAAAGEISLLVLGAVLVVVMLATPEGLVVTIGRQLGRLGRRRPA
jgi:branched-chain amino acid transport system permease protein